MADNRSLILFTIDLMCKLAIGRAFVYSVANPKSERSFEMNTLENLKERLGNAYSFHSELTRQKLKEILAKQDISYANTVAFVLNAGCVNIEATVFLSADGLIVGYDCCVKDRKENGDWIRYDVIPEPVNLDAEDIELEMFQVLDRFVAEQGLSYTECNYGTFKIPKKEMTTNE